MMGLRGVYKKIKQKRMMRRYAEFISLNPDSYYGPGFIIDLRAPGKGKKYLETGEHCVLEGRYVFETERGHIKVGNRVHIGNSMFVSVNEIIIDDDVTIAWDCLVYDHNSHSVNWEERKDDTEREYQDISNGMSPIAHKNWDVVKSAPIHIGSKAWIGTGVTILKGVTIGEGAVIGAGSVVTKDVEPWTVVGGNPAQLIKRLR